MPCKKCPDKQKDEQQYKSVGGILVPDRSEVLHFGKAVMRGTGKLPHAEVLERREKCRTCDKATNRVEPPDAQGNIGPISLTTLSQCRGCKCFIHLKTKFADESCPEKKW